MDRGAEARRSPTDAENPELRSLTGAARPGSPSSESRYSSSFAIVLMLGLFTLGFLSVIYYSGRLQSTEWSSQTKDLLQSARDPHHWDGRAHIVLKDGDSADVESILLSSTPSPTTKRDKRVIGMTVYGNNPKFVAGVPSIIKKYAEIMPEWTVRIYHDETVPKRALDSFVAAVPPGRNPVELVDANNLRAILGLDPGPKPRNFRIWRFAGAFDPQVEYFVSRDSDSYPSVREALAVEEWLQSNKSFHVMRDHPYHTANILAGMFGVKGGYLNRALLPSMLDAGIAKSIDQTWLRNRVWPKIRNDVMIHDSYYCKEPDLNGFGEDNQARPFPTVRTNDKFHVGNRYDVTAKGHTLTYNTRLDNQYEPGVYKRYHNSVHQCCIEKPAPIVDTCVCCKTSRTEEEAQLSKLVEHMT